MKTAIAATLIAVSGAAFASGTVQGNGVSVLEDGQMTYELFEASIDHADLENCPAQFDPEKVFCRLTVAAEQAHVFVFDYDNDQPLVAVQHFELTDDFLPF